MTEARCTVREHVCVTADGMSEACADRVRGDLAAIPSLWQQMHDHADIPVCELPHWRTIVDEDGHPVLGDNGLPTQEQVPCPVHNPASGPLMPGQAGGDKVSGSREAPIGVRVSILSFVGPAMDHRRGLTEHWWASEELGDQVGHRPLRDTLSTWGRSMIDDHPGRLAGPKDASIPALVAWLLARHEWAMKQPWCDEYAVDVRVAADHARRLLSVYDQPSELMAGVPCPGPKCGHIGTLERKAGSSDFVCARSACHTVLRPDEYRRWVDLYASNPKTAADKWQQADQLRVTADEIGESRHLRRHAAELRSIAASVELLTDEEWDAAQARVAALAAVVDARRRRPRKDGAA